MFKNLSAAKQFDREVSAVKLRLNLPAAKYKQRLLRCIRFFEIIKAERGQINNKRNFTAAKL